ncbi:hypothetical protein JKF63_06813 [Porcisia hertigi]|uniref:Kinesin motor domain-containing protein n=1 Tax=Porcisia hertigi TaxID=2761500 RepID=A0A836LJ64_9TRYP|nr:hypothetical protein JKF63_06813 [Porcisia hertigi]
MAERIMVTVRVRPFLPSEGSTRCLAVSENRITVGARHGFVFDHVFDETATSDDVYVALGQPLVDSFLSGFHAATIAYGQTCSGKTFTVTALLSDVVQEIFCRIAEDAEKTQGNQGVTTAPTNSGAASRADSTISMTLSVLEVYNESISDLLAPPTFKSSRTPMASTMCGAVKKAVEAPIQRRSFATGHDPPQEKRVWQRRASAPARSYPRTSLALREEPYGGVKVVGLTEAQVHSEPELLALIDSAIGNRKTASTLMNASSSRSHCVVTLTLRRHGLCSRCSFVDLAGSERLKKSLGLAGLSDQLSIPASAAEASLLPCGTAAARIREGIHINNGLLALGNVIVALCEKKSHVPYRSSTLTRMLQPMLGGNAHTAMVACVSQHVSSLEETLNTLRYAGRAKCIQINPRLSVATAATLMDAQQTILLLRQQLEEAQRRLMAASAAARGPRNAPKSPDTALPPSFSVTSTQEVQRLRELLLQERQVTRRLENDVFKAECTAMIEVEKRKTLESRIARLEAAGTTALVTGSKRAQHDCRRR